MKRIKIYLLMLLAALTVGSCGSDNDGPDGGGGGKPDMAHAGGKNVDGINDAIKAIKEVL